MWQRAARATRARPACVGPGLLAGGGADGGLGVEDRSMHGDVRVRLAQASPAGLVDPLERFVVLADGGVGEGDGACCCALPAGVAEGAAEGEGVVEVMAERERVGPGGQVDLRTHGQRPGPERHPSGVGHEGEGSLHPVRRPIEVADSQLHP